MSEERNNAGLFDGSATSGGHPVQSGMPKESVRDYIKDLLGETDLSEEVVPLPSKGVPYPEGHPLKGRQTVTIRSMRSSDEDILVNKAFFKNGTMFSNLIKSCLIEPKVNPTDILMGDRIAILAAIRISGYGSSYQVKIKCPKCRAESKSEFDISTFGLRELSADPVADGNYFEHTLPVSKSKVVYKYNTGHEEEMVMKRAASGNTSGSQTQSLKEAIISVNGVTDRTKIGLFCDNMKPRDAQSLRKHIAKTEPTLLMESQWTCIECGHDDIVPVPMSETFFRPDDEE